MSKNVLVLCTGNSCRSIIAEALINATCKGIQAYSAGVRANGVVNENAKKVLQEKGIWSEEYHSKTLEEVLYVDYDLVVTVCDHAKESCPMFPKAIKTLHVSFEDPDGKDIEAFYETYEQIRTKLLLKITEVLS